MILQKLKVKNFGPFAHETQITFEPDVTVLTGPNDTGKTSLLRLIHLVCSHDGSAASLAKENDVNFDHVHEIGSTWKKAEVHCDCWFEATDQTSSWYPITQHGKILVTEFKLAPENGKMAIRVEGVRHAETTASRMPAVLFLPGRDEISDVIDLKNPNKSELSLLKVGFGSGFNFAKYKDMSHVRFTQEVAEARQRLTDALKRILPTSLRVSFNLEQVGAQRDQLGVYLLDSHGSHTPLGVRGAGIRNVLTLIGALLRHDLDGGHTLVLVDEPETSLHADSQHMLRRLFEELGTKPAVQVIYATHSAAMINTMRPHSLRLFEREQRNGRATTVVNNKPFGENFSLVRSSLGITAADSLLYAPLCVIVDGRTEVCCLPLLLCKLSEAKIEGFEGVGEVLANAHFVDGCGDTFEQLCRFAQSQGCKVLIFLDGDQGHNKRLAKVRKDYPDVPIIQLPGGMEFEQIVPREIYFVGLQKYLREYLGQQADMVTIQAFQDWEAKNNLPKKMTLTNRVKLWLEDQFETGLEKAAAMRSTLASCKLSDVNLKQLQDLVARMKERLMEAT